MFKRIGYGFFILFFLSILQAAAAEKETAYERVIRTGTLRCGYMFWPPFFDVDPNTGRVFGFNVDVIDGMADMLDLEVEYIDVVVGQQKQDLENGRIDAVCGDAPWVLSTIKYLDYSDPYYYQPSYLYVRAGESRFTSPEDLNVSGVTFIGMDGDVSTDLAARRFPKAQVRSMPSTADSAQLLMEVATGKADAIILDPQSADRFMHGNPGKIRKLSAEPLAVQGGGFSVRKGEQELLNMLNEAIRAGLNTGLVDRVIEKYDPERTLYLPVDRPYRPSTSRMLYNP